MARTTALGVSLLTIFLWAAASVVYSNIITSDVAMSKYPLPPVDLPTLTPTADASASTNAIQQITETGEPYLLNFWASWCVTCQAESRFLHGIADDVPIVGVALKDAPESASRWLNDFGSPYTLSYIDEEGKYAEQLGVQGAPETFLIDGEGNVRFHYQGLMQDTVWRQRVMPILNGLKQD